MILKVEVYWQVEVHVKVKCDKINSVCKKNLSLAKLRKKYAKTNKIKHSSHKKGRPCKTCAKIQRTMQKYAEYAKLCKWCKNMNKYAKVFLEP